MARQAANAVQSEPTMLDRVAEEIRKIDLSGYEKAWAKLDELSSGTVLDFIEVLDDSIILKDGAFVVPFNAHVTLHYGKGSDALESTDAFPGHVKGKVTNKKISIDEVEIDTRSFYE